ncbi:TadE/TadG family type IV pilus assembly protein [Algicella marina]|uniref:Pilus assembly protein n=1 Tax=Algicella marina TaxID=2683284 RepID=A0A6P1T1V8_9RHOB|nr:hypothetical protein [Algicella marina]QHQ35269.1 hypothetical protein GO499_08685 [Algicella marina]
MLFLKGQLERVFRAVRSEEGTVTIEFVILFPLLAAWFLGSFIYFDAYRSKTITAKVAFTMSDLMARRGEMNDADLRDYYEIQKRMMPRRMEKSWMRVSSICYRERELAGETVGEYRLHWSTTFDDFYDADAGELPNIKKYEDDDEIPVNLMPMMADGDSIIFTEVYGTWEPIAKQFSGYMGLSELTWAQRITERPRFTRVISYESEGATNICNAATWEPS